jgi:hypothetical protein
MAEVFHSIQPFLSSSVVVIRQPVRILTGGWAVAVLGDDDAALDGTGFSGFFFVLRPPLVSFLSFLSTNIHPIFYF